MVLWGFGVLATQKVIITQKVHWTIVINLNWEYSVFFLLFIFFWFLMSITTLIFHFIRFKSEWINCYYLIIQSISDRRALGQQHENFFENWRSNWDVFQLNPIGPGLLNQWDSKVKLGLNYGVLWSNRNESGYWTKWVVQW